MTKLSDDQKRDEVLKRMLATPHKPHETKAVAKKAAKSKVKREAKAPIQGANGKKD